ncbi:hypothetical protein L226DRAFT_575065 [Lentinus tigrinus ALCF2SS1-7]|uniref:Uncharacterized protein n=1 Tax=Lentinus tigrinus ALCF2SS1-6 TaxID=1328759 RepID=A0A5C2RUB4_9APHY|nr:hypothetical protein L227DRAFT_615544 [Lentinus tigrinus ALCF2SS1-6]RPD70163.1 hypothetical protein L226DRAFT_575065 [Lentinus tigrinus ALCF2SS1-7]
MDDEDAHLSDDRMYDLQYPSSTPSSPEYCPASMRSSQMNSPRYVTSPSPVYSPLSLPRLSPDLPAALSPLPPPASCTSRRRTPLFLPSSDEEDVLASPPRIITPLENVEPAPREFTPISLRYSSDCPSPPPPHITPPLDTVAPAPGELSPISIPYTSHSPSPPPCHLASPLDTVPPAPGEQSPISIQYTSDGPSSPPAHLGSPSPPPVLTEDNIQLPAGLRRERYPHDLERQLVPVRSRQCRACAEGGHVLAFLRHHPDAHPAQTPSISSTRLAAEASGLGPIDGLEVVVYPEGLRHERYPSRLPDVLKIIRVTPCSPCVDGGHLCVQTSDVTWCCKRCFQLQITACDWRIATCHYIAAATKRPLLDRDPVVDPPIHDSASSSPAPSADPSSQAPPSPPASLAATHSAAVPLSLEARVEQMAARVTHLAEQQERLAKGQLDILESQQRIERLLRRLARHLALEDI